MAKFEATDEQWEKMKKHIKSDKYKKEDFFVFETLAVGDKIVPNRNMKLMPDLLAIMREDAEKGVSLMLNHNWSQLGVQSVPIGKVFDGRIEGSSQDGESTSLYTTQYILRDDSKVDGYSKNDIINLIESGILSDTSVGWGTTRESYKCNICGNSIYDWRKCEHIPGNKYIVNEETNEVKQCIIEAHAPKEKHSGNNVLMENSIVFDGAYPNAVIQSSVGNENENRSLKPLIGKEKLSEGDLIIGYSTNGSINLLYKESSEKGGIQEMSVKNENEVENTELENEVVETVDNTVIETNNEPVNELENSNNEVENNAEVVDTEANNEEVDTEETLSIEQQILNKFGNISDSVDELVELAKEGLEIRNEIISEALESGVHSMGNSFNKDIFIKTFSNMKTKDIKEMGNVWEKQAKDMFCKEKISKQDFSQETNNVFKVPLEQFKTSNY